MLEGLKKIFCIGIGGIGLSALARYYKHQGHEVLGSDLTDSELIQTLKKEGINVEIGANSNHITNDIDMVVYTIAIPIDHPEWMRAKELGIICKTYPEALGEITKEKVTIAICGTHGKTTTTAMVYSAFKTCGIKPTVIIGSLLGGVGLVAPKKNGATPDHQKDGLGTNFISGDSEYLIVEACEYKRSFLNLHPTHVIITNIDADHLDYYKDINDIHVAFQSFADKIPENGFLVTHSDISLLTAGKKINADDINKDSIELSVLGEHNKKNAQLVIALTKELGFDESDTRRGLKDFIGTWRRLEYKGRTSYGTIIYDDYGHHPTELRATFQALREKYPKGEYILNVFFQPHLYSRTKMFLDDFAKVLCEGDKVYIMPIYAAREKKDETINSEILVEKVNTLGGHAELLSSSKDMSQIIESISENNSIVVNIGAGDAYVELSKINFV